MPGSTTHAVPLLDVGRGLVGPVTKRIRRRAMAIWAVVAVLGTVLAYTGVGATWAAFGVGLVFPGAGFLYGAHPVLFVLTVVLFAVGLVLWVGIGALAAPIAVWLGSAVVAAVVAPDVPWAWAAFAVPLAAVAVIALQAALARPRLARQLAVAKRTNDHLATTSLREVPQEYTVGPPLTDEDLGAKRFLLDLALQPLDRFDGFTTIDQFREGAWRYQLYALTESLAMLRSTRLPAFTGYLEAAQRNSILKVTDRKVWKYWFLENMWGNGRLNPDPMVRENIMITGWYALALGAYQITTGDRSIDADGSLPFRWSERRVYEYSYPKIVDTLVTNFDARDMLFYPCEPNWVFSYCNEEGMAGLVLYDRFHGTNHAERLLPKFLTRMEQEFSCADGAQVVIMSNRTGLQLKARSATLYAGSLWLRSMFAPELAAQNWEIVRYEYLREGDDELFELGPLDRVDSGNYRTSSDGHGFYPQMMVAAKEIGDLEVYEYARAKHNALGIENTDGRYRWPGSTFANLTSHMGRFGAPGAWNRLAHSDYPKAWRDGPVLSDVPYPDVLVSRAVSDGRALDVELVPSGVGRFTVGFARLVPGAGYQVEGATTQPVTADAEGRASVEVDLERRTPLQLIPVT